MGPGTDKDKPVAEDGHMHRGPEVEDSKRPGVAHTEERQAGDKGARRAAEGMPCQLLRLNATEPPAVRCPNF